MSEEEAMVDLNQEQSERAFLREKYLRILSKIENNVAEIEMRDNIHVTACVKSIHPDGTKVFVSNATASTMGFMRYVVIKLPNIKTMAYSIRFR
ncbi:hypothetical protein TNCT_74611 [Trichonephila clavata]|uniref:Gem-associated protein 7 n=1 Tax=Trichonephila clavata TaxID=2740835 RepID=A0A8X6IGC7_TRICU|nr:hypothetical protein TNCT_74611 [Trichonephila clavata]